MKTEWNLGLLYKNDKDPQIEKDISFLEDMCANFEKKYKGKDFISTPKKLLTALTHYSKIEDSTTAKPWWYFALRSEADSEDTVASASSSKMQQRLSHASNKITFFILELGKIEPKTQKTYLSEKSLSEYHYFLKKIFDQSKYDLSEKEEQIINLLTQTSYSMWIDGQQKALRQKTILFKGENIPLSKAHEILSELPKNDRNELYESILRVQKEASVFAEAEMNAVFNYKKVLDERRGYKKSYSSTLLSHEMDEKTVEDLRSIVGKYLKISQKFYKLHAKLLGEKVLSRADRAVWIGRINKSFTFSDSVEIVKNSFSRLDKKYADIVQSFVDNKQLDIYPRNGKAGGAFCWGMGDLPIYVLLNHTDDIRSVETLAHEMGHSIHGMLSKFQPSQYRGHSTATAEVASTFFEQLVTDELSKTLTEDEQTILLHGKLLGDITSIFAQIAGFNYEVELHEKIRAEGQVSADGMAELLAKHLRSYTGSAIKTTTDDGYHFVSWWHTRMFFYVYSYAYGQLVSRSLYERWKADPSYAKKIEQFLSAGQSMSPKDIFKSIGINTNEAFFEAGLKGIEADIDKLEKLSKNWLKKQKNK